MPFFLANSFIIVHPTIDMPNCSLAAICDNINQAYDEFEIFPNIYSLFFVIIVILFSV